MEPATGHVRPNCANTCQSELRDHGQNIERPEKVNTALPVLGRIMYCLVDWVLTRKRNLGRPRKGGDVSDINQWLSGLGLERFASVFAEAEIDLETLPDLAEADLVELGLPLGPRRRIWGAIQRSAGSEEPPVGAENAVASSGVQNPVTAAVSSDAERRHLTVMFVDLVGSTEMAGRIDAEDMRNVITSYQNTVAGVVSRYEGFVAKFMGDGVLCYFGWPRANEDDAERAVRAGLSIIDSVKNTRESDGTPLATRVGIATGVVIVGDLIGSGATQEAAVVGETPNLAARLQGFAEPNQLVLPDETRRLLGGAYQVRSLGGQELKGIGAPVEVFVVIGEVSQESRFAARQTGTLTPIVGREREIELILERWAMARARKGQMVIVSGEAGIGKSRITRAVIDAVAQDEHVRMTYQCSPYHADSAFYPVTQQMALAAGFAHSDSSETRLDKLESLLGKDRATLRLIAPLMGLDGAVRYGAPDLTPAQQRAQIMLALGRLLVRQATKKPVLLVYEDLHWIDPTSLELLETLLDEIAEAPIMILATARPTFEYGFGGNPIVTRLALNRLGKDQIGVIAAKLTGGRALPDEIMAIIAQRTDGVPLFVEELTKTILESGAVMQDGDRFVLNGPLSTIAIPTTLHDSLMARLDRLQPIKEVAQTAACIGRGFSHGLLARIARLPEPELATALDGLISAELVYRRGLPPEATYLFKHALVRDAAYESLLKGKRRAIHVRILAALEADPDIAHEVLAVHAEAAGLTDRAIDLWEAASKVALGRPAFDEALSHLGHAIKLITPQLDTGDSFVLNRALSLQVPLGMALLTRRGYGADETVAAFKQALAFADRVGETPMRYSILYGLWVATGIRGQHAEALRTAEALVDLAGRSSDSSSVVVAHRVAGSSHWFMGNTAVAEHHLEIALSHFDPLKHAGLADRYGQDIGVSLHVFLACVAMTLGKTSRALAHAAEAERLAQSTGHVQTICYAAVILSLCYLAVGDDAKAQRSMKTIEPIAQEHDLLLWIAYIASFSQVIAARRGDKNSIERFKSADQKVIDHNCTFFGSQLRISVGWSALEMGLGDEAAELASMAEGLIEKTGETYALSDLHRLQAAIVKADGDNVASQRYLEIALDVARQQSARLWELRAAIDLARLWQAKGRIKEAVSLLRPVHESIAEGDCPEDQAKARALLAELGANVAVRL
ncbi:MULTISPECIES: adenylate/guanylate cyclase domain-containing protein [unclassified Minwuia]|jgi:class 3 adenylate cyclase/ABC-type transport system involved in cytochrome c biogenesis ATPase subunit/tetratricopeptide (TPR) repeat protein|uniref:AAA family ATPase n=1 Tax=unclassified Minwuia TaxID=2618799 RepID=UPI00247AEBE5|nr:MULTISPECIES: adenylate/guanylate cyclase domain-containing protein [unclassified Minwuia]